MATKVDTHPLISIRSSATVQEAARLMADCSIAAIGVLDGNKRFAGIVTERDLAWFLAQGRDAAETVIEEITNDFPVVVQGAVDDRAAIDRMRAAHVRHLTVHEGDDYRILSMRDFAPLVLESLDYGKTASDVMTAPAIACRQEAFFEEVAETLADRDISGMPVVDSAGKVVGVVSERDLAYALGGPMVRLALRRHNERKLHGVAGLPRGARRAKDIMTTPALTVSIDASLDHLARLMRVHQLNRLPVLEGDRLVGIVTRGDVLAAMGHIEHEPIDLSAAPVLVGSAGLHPSQGMYE